MTKTIEEANKALVLEAFETLFNKRDYKAAERFWSPNYIQHSAHIPPGREGLFNLIKSAPPTLRYEHGVILADKENVIVHGRFSGHGLSMRNWIAADIVRIADGMLVEHWDVSGGSARTLLIRNSPPTELVQPVQAVKFRCAFWNLSRSRFQRLAAGSGHALRVQCLPKMRSDSVLQSSAPVLTRITSIFIERILFSSARSQAFRLDQNRR